MAAGCEPRAPPVTVPARARVPVGNCLTRPGEDPCAMLTLCSHLWGGCAGGGAAGSPNALARRFIATSSPELARLAALAFGARACWWPRKPRRCTPPGSPKTRKPAQRRTHRTPSQPMSTSISAPSGCLALSDSPSFASRVGRYAAPMPQQAASRVPLPRAAALAQRARSAAAARRTKLRTKIFVPWCANDAERAPGGRARSWAASPSSPAAAPSSRSSRSSSTRSSGQSPCRWWSRASRSPSPPTGGT